MQLPAIVLGSAQWGWNVTKQSAFDILDGFLAKGLVEIDAATNYPLNETPADFRISEKILAEYIHAHGLSDLKITMKIGSLSNFRVPDINLSKSFIIMMAEEYQRLFNGNLSGIMLHWDNREDQDAIEESLEALAYLQGLGLQPGLSGVKHPDVYAKVNERFQLNFDIELKNNVLHSDLPRYAPLVGSAKRFLAYGINAGGVKINEQYDAVNTLVVRGANPVQHAEKVEKIRQILPIINAQVRPPVTTMNQLGLIFNGLNPAVGGIIIGVSSVAQLNQSIEFFRNLSVFDYSDVLVQLKKLNK